MKTLKEKFGKNGLPYTMIKRNELVAMFSLHGEYSNDIIGYEVDRIEIRDDQYGIREAIPSNEQFGKEGSACFGRQSSVLADNYYDALTNVLKTGIYKQKSFQWYKLLDKVRYNTTKARKV